MGHFASPALKKVKTEKIDKNQTRLPSYCILYPLDAGFAALRKNRKCSVHKQQL